MPLIEAIDEALALARVSGAAAAAERLERAREIALAGPAPCGELSGPAAEVWRAVRLARGRMGRGDG
ncbi:MAG: hypothetical protein AB7F67_22205 [Rhodospirillaceae bacterium]